MHVCVAVLRPVIALVDAALRARRELDRWPEDLLAVEDALRVMPKCPVERVCSLGLRLVEPLSLVDSEVILGLSTELS